MAGLSRFRAFLLMVAATGCSSSFTAEDAATRLVFQAAPTSGARVSEEELAALKRVVEARLRESRIVPDFVVQTTPAGELQILLPALGADAKSRIERLVTRPGTLEFAVLANLRDHSKLIAQAGQNADQSGETTQWVPLATRQNGQPVDMGLDGDVITREVETDGDTVREFLVVLREPQKRVTDELLSGVSLEEGPGGRLALGFRLSEQGGYVLRNLTAGSAPAPNGFRRRLGIILDGELVSAPYINDPIGGRGIIEGGFIHDQAEEIVWSLNAGRLPVPLLFIEAKDVPSP